MERIKELTFFSENQIHCFYKCDSYNFKYNFHITEVENPLKDKNFLGYLVLTDSGISIIKRGGNKKLIISTIKYESNFVCFSTKKYRLFGDLIEIIPTGSTEGFDIHSMDPDDRAVLRLMQYNQT